MNLGKIRGAVERPDHFEIDAGDGAPFKVAKSALSEQMVEKVRRLYCGGKVEKFALGGEVLMPPGPASFREAYPGVLASDETSPFFAPGSKVGIPSPVVGGSSEQPGIGLLGQLERALATRKPEPTPAAPEPEAAQAPPVPPLPLPTDVASAPAESGPGFLGALLAPMAVGSAAPVERPAVPEEPAAPTLPSPDQLAQEARSAGQAAARQIAEAGDLAKRSLEQRAAAEAQARAAEYSAAEGLVRAQDEAAARAEQEAQRLRETYQRGENAMRLQREKLAQREKDLGDVENMRIESGRVFSRTDPVGLIMGAMMVGAAEAGLRKGSGSEAALKVIGDAIDRDVLAQKTEIEGVRSARLRAYEAAVGDVNNAAQLLKADQQLVAAAAARAESQRTQSAQGRLMLAKLSSDLSAQARQTADEAVKLITGTAIAEQKAAQDAEARQIGLRQAQAAMVRGEAELASARRQEQRADISLAMSEEKLGLERAGQVFGQAMAVEQLRAQQAKAGAIDYDVLGKMGYPLPPQAYAQISDDRKSAAYVMDENEKGETVYRRARDVPSAEKVVAAQQAAKLALAQLDKIERYIPGPGKKAPSTFGFGEDARKAQAEIEAATQALTTQLKEVEKLGALTGADLELIKPRIPTAQAWFATDAAERQQAGDLRAAIDGMVQAIIDTSVAPDITGATVKTTKKKGST